MDGHDRELGEIHTSLEYLKCGVTGLRNDLRAHREAFDARLDEHEKEEREHRKLVWDKIGNLSNMILWASGGVSGVYLALKFFFKV